MKIFKKIQKQRLVASLIIAGIVIALFTGIKYASAATPTLKLTPSSGNYSSGNVFNTEVRVESDQAVNAVQANLKYSSNLQVVGISYAGSAYEIEAQSTYGNGQIRIARGTFNTVTGDNLLATITFKSMPPTNASVVFNSDSALVRANDGVNILGYKQNAYYKIRK